MSRKAYGLTDTGLVRTNNEDAVLVINEKTGGLPNLYIVADGMGGHNAGEVASGSAVSCFLEYIENTENFGSIEVLLSDACKYANKKVYEMSREFNTMYGMGTTLTVCVISGGTLYYAHIGDSRLYIINDKITQITTDHTLVAEMIKSGALTEEDALTHPERHVITRAVGTNCDVPVDTGSLEISENTFVLLCSDGLTGMLTDKEIFNIITRGSENKTKILNKLIKAAKANGGIDNISAILI